MIVFTRLIDSHQIARISHVFALEGIDTLATTRTLEYEPKNDILYNPGCPVLPVISSKPHPIIIPLQGG